MGSEWDALIHNSEKRISILDYCHSMVLRRRPEMKRYLRRDIYQHRACEVDSMFPLRKRTHVRSASRSGRGVFLMFLSRDALSGGRMLFAWLAFQRPWSSVNTPRLWSK